MLTEYILWIKMFKLCGLGIRKGNLLTKELFIFQISDSTTFIIDADNSSSFASSSLVKSDSK